MTGDELLALALFVLFALLSATGAFLILDRLRGRRPAVIAALLVAAFFIALLLGIRLLLREAGLP